MQKHATPGKAAASATSSGDSSVLRVGYKHTSKTGGTYVGDALRKSFAGDPSLFVDLGELPNYDMHRSDRLFVIGTIAIRVAGWYLVGDTAIGITADTYGSPSAS